MRLASQPDCLSGDRGSIPLRGAFCGGQILLSPLLRTWSARRPEKPEVLVRLQARMALRSVPVKPKKLADSLCIRIAFNDGMPHSWRAWLRDFSYWNGELDADSN